LFFSLPGSRTKGGAVYSSRNLDWNKATGIDAYKLVTVLKIADVPMYTNLGFTVGLGALAGMSSRGVTVSEMNLDNSNVTFLGVPFPLRLRWVMEQASDLSSAITAWRNTNNTNSFNFLIAAAADARSEQGAAVALETIKDYSEVTNMNTVFYRCT
jgi:hypothetical protein